MTDTHHKLKESKMRKTINSKLFALIALIFLFPSVAFTQIFDADFLKGGVDNGIKIFESYLSPWARAFGAGLNGGWYNTAKPHKFGGFDITITASAAMVPDNAMSFDLSTIGLENIRFVNPDQTIAPTAAGAKGSGPAMVYYDNISGTNVDLATFYSPGGNNTSFIPVPMIQAGVGLPFSSEIIVRYTPNIPILDGNFGMWGLGLKHSIMQYIPGDKMLPFDVTLFGGYTKISGNTPIEVLPTSYVNYSSAYNTPAAFANQEVSANVSGWNVGVIGSFNLPIVTFYSGLGYSSSRTLIEVIGNIPTPEADPTTFSAIYTDSGVINDIEGIDIQDFSGLRFNIGLRLKFAIFTIHGDYTRSEYNVFSTGIGVSFR